MEKCQKCGAPLHGEQVCPKCGARAAGRRYLKEQPKAAAVNRTIWVLLVVILAAAVAVGSFFVTRAFQHSPRETVPPHVYYDENAQTEAPTEAPATEAPTTEATTEPTEPPTTEPPVVHRNPLNGTILEEPYTGRIFGLTISNTPEVLPHVNATKADIIFESFVNGSIIRYIGLFTDMANEERIGPIRSTRLVFNDITEHYNLVLVHAGGSGQVLRDAKARGIDNFNIDAWVCVSAGCSIRDDARSRKIGYVHSLLAMGPQIVEYAGTQGIALTQPEDKDYLLRFNDDGTPADGETANEIDITITYKTTYKQTILNYNPETGKYEYSQYAKVMKDWDTDEVESYRNVIVMFTNVSADGMYQTMDFCAGGEGYFACGGRLIPITWGCDGEDQPFWYKTLDGEELELGVGNSYIAITQPGSEVTWHGGGEAETE